MFLYFMQTISEQHQYIKINGALFSIWFEYLVQKLGSLYSYTYFPVHRQNLMLTSVHPKGSVIQTKCFVLK